MSLQTELPRTPAHTGRESNVVSLPPSELLRMVDDLRQALRAKPESASVLALEFLKRIASLDEAAIDARGGLAPWQKRKIGRHLKDNLERSVRMEEFAALVKLSVSHFCRAFKRSFGETPHAHVVRLRLELAQRLMLTTNDPLSQIALSCGLADQAHLSKLFRRAFDDTPNAWRRRNLIDPQAGTNCQVVPASIRQAA